jgi:3-hydroxyisobutyrate dehydrogenase-like beta-hydroxyacid dehydrogenase
MIIACIGLGNMGFSIAKNLHEGGFTVRAYNRGVEKRNAIRQAGVPIADSEAEAVKDADIVVTMLSDDAAVSDVSGKILNVMKRDAIHLSMSTIAPATASKLAVLHEQHHVHYVAGPVLGRPPAAAAKQLFVLLSGQAKAREAVKSILPAISQRFFEYGDDPSTAHAVKVMVNYMIFVTTEMLSEVMLVGEKTGVKKDAFLDTLLNTVFGAPVIKIYGNLVAEEKENLNGFATRLASKDLRLMQETAALHDMKLPLAEVIQQNFLAMMEAGKGEQDVTSLVTHLRNTIVKTGSII